MTGFSVHVRDHPTLFSLLDRVEREREEFAPEYLVNVVSAQYGTGLQAVTTIVVKALLEA